VRYRLMSTLLGIGLLAGSGASVHAQQTGAVVVEVTDRQTGEPLSAAQVTLVGTRFGGITDQNGRYLMPQVPVGTYTLAVTYLGYSDIRRATVVVAAGGTARVPVGMEQAVLSLQEIVVAGVTDPTAGVKLPMTVSRVTTEQLMVPTTNSALAAMQGKVAGASVIRATGKPGDGVYIQLRSLTGFETDATPLLVVDGVILSRSFSGTTADIESMDIESIEIIKGAAAAALYGSRAAAGVVSITTARGANLPRNETRITARTEVGRDVLASTVPIATSHHYLMNDAGTSLRNAAGRDTTWGGRTPTTLRIADIPYPGQTYDNLRALYQPGQYLSQNISLSQNTENTTFMLSGTRMDQGGALANNNGFQRNTGRISLDHRLGDKIRLALVGTHTRSMNDGISGNPYTAILTYPAFVDLTKKDENGQYLMQPDPSVEIENPLWRQGSRSNFEGRARTLGSVNARYTPLQWLTLEGQYSYDRSDIKNQVFVPKGTPLSVIEDSPSQGQYSLSHRASDTHNAHVGAVLMRQFGDLNVRLTNRGLLEREESEYFFAEGRDFIVRDTRDLNVAGTVYDVGSSTRDIRANGFLMDLALDFRGRYIGSFLVRRDGSSLFGPDERWQTYRRAAAAYRISEEAWFNVPHINELKFRYAMGEAGGRPGYEDQYESWNVSRTGGLSRNTAGNAQLRPQFTREQEFGIDVIGFNNRVQLELVYASQVSRDQIIALPITVITGFNSVMGNGATIQGHTYEATIQAYPVRTRNTTWNLSLVADRGDNKITHWGRACFFGSNAGRTHEYTCEGERAGDFWTQTHVRSADQLPAAVASRLDQFQVNDEGYLVWVGAQAGNTWRDGMQNKCGTTSGHCWGSFFSAGGVTYRWGEPIRLNDEEGLPVRVKAGTSIPDLNFGLTQNLRYKNFSIYGALRGQLGGNVYNDVRQWGYGQLRHGDLDQTGKPDELKKTIDYYQRGLYNGYAWTDIFLEDGTHVKLGELAVRYRFGRSQLQRVLGQMAPADITVGVNGRNLALWTRNYTGFDPEAGTQFSRVESVRYPHLRTFTATFDITF
jgi:TonB-linked SusC/RagA family outer membrane protein